MGLRIVISASRKCREEKKLLKELLQEEAGTSVEEVYDCDDTTTHVSEISKQEGIDKIIARCDWFILLSSIGWVGAHTKEELRHALECHKRDGSPCFISMVFCSNPQDAREWYEVREREEGSVDNAELEKLVEDIFQSDKKNYFLDYVLLKDPNLRYNNFEKIMRKEIRMFLQQDLLLERHTRSCSEVKPVDIFFNPLRTEKEKGFREDFYVPRQELDERIYRAASEKTVVLVTGAPASGKSRAVYEFIKRIGKENPLAKFISVKKQMPRAEEGLHAPTLKRLIQDVSSHLELLERNHRSPESRVLYCVCDQIDDLMRNQVQELEFLRFIENLSFIGGHLLLTATYEGYEVLEKMFREGLDSETVEHIEIRGVSENPEFLRSVREGFDYGEEPQGEVVGDYIPALKGYHDSIVHEIDNLSRRYGTQLEHFMQGYQTVRMFRRGEQLPLFLTLMVARTCEINRPEPEFEQDYFALFRFFYRNHILCFERFTEDLLTGETLVETCREPDRIRFDYRKEREYDGERMVTLVDPGLYLSVQNDYIWQELECRYLLDPQDQPACERIMDQFYETFHAFAPVNTLRRILVRAPSLSYERLYKTNPNFTADYVRRKLTAEMQREDPENFNNLVSLILGRYDDVTTIRTILENYRNFTPNQNTAAELLGAAEHKSGEIRQELIRMAEKMYDPSGPISFYLHARRIALEKNLDQALAYIRVHELEKELTRAAGIACSERTDAASRKDLYDCKMIIGNLVRKISSKEDVEAVLDLLERVKWPMDKKLILQMILAGKEFRTLPERQCYLEYLYGELNRIYPEIFEEYAGSLIYQFILASKSYCVGRIFYRKGLKFDLPGQNSRLIHFKWLNMLCRNTLPHEDFYLRADLFQHYKLRDEYAGDKLSMQCRNAILGSMSTFSEAIEILPALFEDDEKSEFRPDLYTMSALAGYIAKELRRKKGERNDEINDKKENSNNAFEKVIQICAEPMLRHLNPIANEVFITFYNAVETPVQEAWLREYVEGKSSSPEKDWADFLDKPAVAGIRIHKPYNTDPDMIAEIAYRVIRKSLSCNRRSIKSEMAATYMKRLRTLGEEFPALKERIEPLKREFDRFLHENNHEVLNRIMKDEYYYNAYFSLFGEKLVRKDENGTYQVTGELSALSPWQVNGNIIYNSLLGCIPLGEDAVRCVERWWMKHYPHILCNAFICRKLKDRLPGYRLEIGTVRSKHGKNDDAERPQSDAAQSDKSDSLEKFLALPAVTYAAFAALLEDFRKLGADRFPNIRHLHCLLKNEFNDNKRKTGRMCLLFPSQLFDVLNVLFVERKYEIPTSLLNSALAGINRYVDVTRKKLHQRVDYYRQFMDFKKRYAPDTPLDALACGLLLGLAPADETEWLLVRIEKMPFRPIVVLSKLVENETIRYSRFDVAARYIEEYCRLSNLICYNQKGRAKYLLEILTNPPKVETFEEARAFHQLLDGLDPEKNLSWLKSGLESHFAVRENRKSFKQVIGDVTKCLGCDPELKDAFCRNLRPIIP